MSDKGFIITCTECGRCDTIVEVTHEAHSYNFSQMIKMKNGVFNLEYGNAGGYDSLTIECPCGNMIHELG